MYKLVITKHTVYCNRDPPTRHVNADNILLDFPFDYIYIFIFYFRSIKLFAFDFN